MFVLVFHPSYAHTPFPVLCVFPVIFFVVVHRFTNLGDLQWFDKCLSRVVSEEMSEELVEFVDPTHYFTSFMRYTYFLRNLSTVNLSILVLFLDVLSFPLFECYSYINAVMQNAV